jgi:hypothetical protein
VTPPVETKYSSPVTTTAVPVSESVSGSAAADWTGTKNVAAETIAAAMTRLVVNTLGSTTPRRASDGLPRRTGHPTDQTRTYERHALTAAAPFERPAEYRDNPNGRQRDIARSD